MHPKSSKDRGGGGWERVKNGGKIEGAVGTEQAYRRMHLRGPIVGPAGLKTGEQFRQTPPWNSKGLVGQKNGSKTVTTSRTKKLLRGDEG